MKNQNRRSLNRGFTLIELVITMAIIGILTAIAYPAYTGYIERAKRADAQAQLNGLAQRLERHFLDGNTYCGAVVAGDCTAGTPRIFSAFVPPEASSAANAYYDLTINPLTARAYTLNAAPRGSMAGDECGTLTLSSTGVQGVTGATGGKTAADCWRN